MLTSRLICTFEQADWVANFRHLAASGRMYTRGLAAFVVQILYTLSGRLTVWTDLKRW